MAVDMFLELDKGTVPGESKDDKHKDKMDVLAWSWGMSQGGTMHKGGGGGSGKANFQDISITKWYCKASPTLALYCANGDHFAQGKLIVRKAGKTPLEYITIDMTDIIVTSVQTGGSGGEEALTENVTLNFAKVEVYYIEQTVDGGEGAKPEFKWDIRANVPM